MFRSPRSSILLALLCLLFASAPHARADFPEVRTDADPPRLFLTESRREAKRIGDGGQVELVARYAFRLTLIAPLAPGTAANLNEGSPFRLSLVEPFTDSELGGLRIVRLLGDATQGSVASRQVTFDWDDYLATGGANHPAAKCRVSWTDTAVKVTIDLAASGADGYSHPLLSTYIPARYVYDQNGNLVSDPVTGQLLIRPGITNRTFEKNLKLVFGTEEIARRVVGTAVGGGTRVSAVTGRTLLFRVSVVCGFKAAEEKPRLLSPTSRDPWGPVTLLRVTAPRYRAVSCTVKLPDGTETNLPATENEYNEFSGEVSLPPGRQVINIWTTEESGFKNSPLRVVVMVSSRPQVWVGQTDDGNIPLSYRGNVILRAAGEKFFTGTLALPKGTLRFRGQWNEDGTAEVSVPGLDRMPWTLRFSPTGSSGLDLSGELTVSDGTLLAFSMVASSINEKRPLFSERITLFTEHEDGGFNVGAAWARGIISPTGNMRLVGRLPSGMAFTGGHSLPTATAQMLCPLRSLPSTEQAVFSLTFVKSDYDYGQDIAGTLTWEDQTDTSLPPISSLENVTGHTYNQSLIYISSSLQFNTSAFLYYSGLLVQRSDGIFVGSDGNLDRIRMTINPLNGAVSGMVAVEGRMRSFSGVIVQGFNRVEGRGLIHIPGYTEEFSFRDP